MPLIKDLNLEEEMVYNETGISYIYSDNTLHPIPSDTIFGIPMSVQSLFSSTLVSTKGKIVALKDFITKIKRVYEGYFSCCIFRKLLGKES